MSPVRYELCIYIPGDGILHVGFLIFTAVTMKNGDFWDVLRSVLRLLVTANVLISAILAILMMVALSSFETSVHTKTTRRNITEDAILHSHRRENLKFYTHLLCLEKMRRKTKAAVLTGVRTGLLQI
jgi:hypothetical protein